MLKLRNKPVIEISKILNNSKRMIYIVLSRNNNFDKKPRRCWPGATYIQTIKKYAIRQFKNDIGVKISKKSIYTRRLQELYKRVSCNPCINTHHKQVRINCARKYMLYRNKCFSVWFSWKEMKPGWNLMARIEVAGKVYRNSCIHSSVGDKAVSFWWFGEPFASMAKPASHFSMGNKIQHSIKKRYRKYASTE